MIYRDDAKELLKLLEQAENDEDKRRRADRQKEYAGTEEVRPRRVSHYREIGD